MNTLKGLTLFLVFNATAFFKDKLLTIEQCIQWLGDNGEVLGTKILLLIVQDNTKYPSDKPISNRHRMITVKVPKVINLPVDSKVILINPLCKVYGEFRNQLSITCEDVVLAEKK